MFTVCPKCSLKLVVTAADLRVAQGYVRCGRCANVFNALVGLSDEEQAVLSRAERGAGSEPPEPPRQAPATPRSVEIAPAALSESDALSRPTALSELGTPLSDSALEFDAAATDVSEVFVEARPDDVASTGQSETIILRGEDEPADPLEQAADHPDGAAQISDPQQRLSDPQQIEKSLEETDEFELADLELLLESSVVRESAEDASASCRSPETREPPDPQPLDPQPRDPQPLGLDSRPPEEVTASEEVAASAELEGLGGLDTAAPRPQAQWLLGAGTAVLVLLLAAQVVHHYRARLVEVAWLRRPLTATYAALGMPFAPHWNVRAYEVRQLGAVVLPSTSGAPGALTVRASVENTASSEQPLPLLRVTVQDRFGNRVAARDVEPQAYLPKTGARLGYLGAGQRVDAEIAFVDPGPRVVGFEIDACLEDREGRIACAHQPSVSR